MARDYDHLFKLLIIGDSGKIFFFYIFWHFRVNVMFDVHFAVSMGQIWYRIF